MLGIMKSCRRQEKILSCPCLNTCLCHQPKKNEWFSLIFPWFPLIFPIAIPITMPLIWPLLVVWLTVHLAHNMPEHHVQYQGKDCVLHSMVKNCTSTGACDHYDEIFCLPEK
jgi:hypothetical protein